MDIKHLINRRCLICVTPKTSYPVTTVKEVKILEVSPSGQWTKTMDMHGQRYWQPTTSLSLVEVLTELTSKPSELKPQE